MGKTEREKILKLLISDALFDKTIVSLFSFFENSIILAMERCFFLTGAF